MAKSRTEIDKEMMYRKIMPTAAKKTSDGGPEGTPGALATAQMPDGSAESKAASGVAASPTASVMAKAIRRTSVAIPFKEEQEMILVNLMEELVAARLDTTLDRFNCCKCNKCKKDIAALALNRLKPRYVVMREDDEERRKEASEQYGSEVTSALVQAIMVVKKEPRH